MRSMMSCAAEMHELLRPMWGTRCGGRKIFGAIQSRFHTDSTEYVQFLWGLITAATVYGDRDMYKMPFDLAINSNIRCQSDCITHSILCSKEKSNTNAV